MPPDPAAAAQPGKTTTQWRSVLAPGPRLVQLFVMGAAVAALVGGGYYALDILRSTSFNPDRAFRVLTQIVAQLDNFQGTMTSLQADSRVVGQLPARRRMQEGMAKIHRQARRPGYRALAGLQRTDPEGRFQDHGRLRGPRGTA
jgi:hypothetical protein